MLCFWSVKGGSGCSVTAAVAALLAAERREALLVDLAGEQAAILGVAPDASTGLGVWLGRGEPPPPDALARLERPIADRLRLLSFDPDDGGQPRPPEERVELLAQLLRRDHRQVVVDVGTGTRPWARLLQQAEDRILVIRPCYLALRRAADASTPTGVVLVGEPGRALTAADVSSVVDAPVLVRLPVDPAIARVVDAGLLASRVPRPLRRLNALLTDGHRP